jgi:hypothetical protein
MKTIQHLSGKDSIDNRLGVSNHQNRIPKSKLSTGSVTDLFPVILDGGRTIIYITDKSREGEIRSKYALRK